MTQDEWLDYLRNHPGSYEPAHKLYLDVLYGLLTKRPPNDAVDDIARLLTAFGKREMELKNEL